MATKTKPTVSEEKVTTVKKTTSKLTPSERRAKRETKKDLSKDQAKELDTKNLKDTVKTQVTSMRELKWKYPEDITLPLERKEWRSKQRREMNKLEAAVGKNKDNPKELKKAETQLKSFRKQVLMVP